MICVYLSAKPFFYDMEKRNSDFRFRFLLAHTIGIENSKYSIFVFRFSTTLKMEFQLVYSFLVFPQP